MSIEARIKEQRTIEATKKNLIGMEGKIYLIARFLGNEIVYQSSEQNYLDDYENNIDEYTIPVIDDSTVSNVIGYNFSGLNYGHNLEIVTEDYSMTIKLYFNGRILYKESSGDLESYSPHESWEKVVDYFYEIAEKKIKKYLEEKEKREKMEMQSLKKNTIEDLQSKWGNIF
jgi:hypothetical protein